jgi:hypothetical protein
LALGDPRDSASIGHVMKYQRELNELHDERLRRIKLDSVE